MFQLSMQSECRILNLVQTVERGGRGQVSAVHGAIIDITITYIVADKTSISETQALLILCVQA